MSSLQQNGTMPAGAGGSAQLPAAGDPRVIWLGLWPAGGGAYWWLSNGDQPPLAGHVEAAALAGPLAMLAEALPQQQPGETVEDAVRRAAGGPLADPDRERALAVDLGALLIPPALRKRLLAAAPQHPDDPPELTVVVAPGPSLARVPWELLALNPDGDRRLLQVCYVRGGLSPANIYGRARQPDTGRAGPALRVIDPEPALRVYTDAQLERWETRGDADGGLVYSRASTTPCTRYEFARLLGGDPAAGQPTGGAGSEDAAAWAAVAAQNAAHRLAAPSRLLYFGHASSGADDQPAAAAIHLAGGGLNAADWIRHPDTWPMPPRVAIVACHSNDAHTLEQMGLVIAAANAGAELITTTRWTLPTDAYAPGGAEVTPGGVATPTTDLAEAIDDAHASAHPLHQLRAWQLDQLQRWQTGQLDAAPLVWAAPVSYLAPDSSSDQPPDGDPTPGPTDDADTDAPAP